MVKGKEMTQLNKLIKHFNATGSITLREALMDYSIQCLTKRIQELRGLGFKIETIKKKHPTTGQKYARYVLRGKPSKLFLV
jgi:biotin operon repressor